MNKYQVLTTLVNTQGNRGLLKKIIIMSILFIKGN